MTKKVIIPYFHKALKYTTPLIFGLGLFIILKGFIIWGLLLLLIGYVILSTKYITEINLKDKLYRDYLFFLGFHLDEEISRFQKLDHIVITKGDYSQAINTRSRSRQLDWVDYSGTLLFDGNQSLNLLTRNEKDELVKGLKDFAEFLDVGIEDRTTHHHYWIDLMKI